MSLDVRQAVRWTVQSAFLKAGYRITRVHDPGDIRTDDLTDSAFLASVRRCKPYTMTSVERMYALWQAVEHVERHDVPGDIVECGVWRGGSSMLAALATTHFANPSRHLWLFDTFKGMTDPGPNDVYDDGTPIESDWCRHADPRDPLFAYASLEEVQRNVARTKYPGNLVTFVQGKVEETIAEAPVERISVLRLDTDWYASTKLELALLWGRLSPNGVLIIDDYGHFPGARRAVDEFFSGRPDAPLLHRVDYTGRVAVKR